jgi:hypothetical protein
MDTGAASHALRVVPVTAERGCAEARMRVLLLRPFLPRPFLPRQELARPIAPPGRETSLARPELRHRLGNRDRERVGASFRAQRTIEADARLYREGRMRARAQQVGT